MVALGGQQAAHEGPLLRPGEQSALDALGPQHVEREAVHRGDGEDVDPAGEVGEDGVAEAERRVAVAGDDEHARRTHAAGEPEVAMEESRRLPRARSAPDAQGPVAVVDDLLLGRGELHRRSRYRRGVTVSRP